MEEATTPKKKTIAARKLEERNDWEIITVRLNWKFTRTQTDHKCVFFAFSFPARSASSDEKFKNICAHHSICSTLLSFCFKNLADIRRGNVSYKVSVSVTVHATLPSNRSHLSFSSIRCHPVRMPIQFLPTFHSALYSYLCSPEHTNIQALCMCCVCNRTNNISQY